MRFLQAEFLVLAHELERRAAEEKRVHGVDVAGNLRQVRREVMDRYGRPKFLGDLAAFGFKGALEASDGFPAEGVIEGDGGDLAQLERVIGVLAEGMIGLAAGVTGADDPPAAQALGEVVSGNDRVNHGNLGRFDVRRQRIARRGKQAAGHDAHAVELDELLCLGEGIGRDAFVIFGDHFDLSAAGLIADLLEVEQHAVQNVAAVLRVGAGKRSQEADANGIGGGARWFGRGGGRRQ